MQQELQKIFFAEKEPMNLMPDKAKREERCARAAAVLSRLETLAVYITREGLSGNEAAELLHREVTRYDNESQEPH